MGIWMGRAFVIKETGSSKQEVDRTPYPEFLNEIEFYSDPKKFGEKTSRSKESIEEKLASVKRAKARREEIEIKKREEREKAIRR